MMWFSVMCQICSVFVTVQLLHIQLHSIFQDLAASDVYVCFDASGLMLHQFSSVIDLLYLGRLPIHCRIFNGMLHAS